jgi:hypothetical protein
MRATRRDITPTQLPEKFLSGTRWHAPSTLAGPVHT